MRFSIHSKLALILALAATQGVCLFWGFLVFESWLQGEIRGTVHKQVLEDNIQTARQMAKLIDEMHIGDPREDADSWNRLQSAVRGIQLPNEGFVCVTDGSTGYVLCHPKLRARPSFSPAGMVKKPMDAAATGEPAEPKPPMQKPPMQKPMMAKTPAVEPAHKPSMDKGGAAEKKLMTQAGKPAHSGSGDRSAEDDVVVQAHIVETLEGLQIIAAAELPEINARVLVHQLGRGIDVAIARITEPIRPIGLAVSLGLLALTTVGVVGVVRRYESRLAEINRNLEKLVAKRTRSLMKTRNGLIFGLAKLAESRDTDTGEHLERIAKYVKILARQLKEDGLPFTDQEIEDMALASSLHDIGKVGVPDAVLLKPGRLEPDERAIIETHTRIGGDCLQALSEQLGDDDFLQVAEEIAYGHHERWDGGGYPFQRSGAQIPLSARIVAVADVYDALRSKRPYKDGMPHDKARDILVEESGSHFDPVVIEAFLAAEERFRAVEPEAGTSDPGATEPKAVAAV